MKRSCVDNGFLNSKFDSEPLAVEDHGKKLREFMVLNYTRSAVVTAYFIGELCNLITNAGGRGVADLASSTHNSSRHLKLVLGKEYIDPDLYYIDTPAYSKKSASRTSVRMPIELPSRIFSRELEGHEEPTSSTEPLSSSSRFECKAWLENETRKSSTLHWSRIIPCSLYWDGFLYGVRESAVGIYIRNLRTNVQHLMAIFR